MDNLMGKDFEKGLDRHGAGRPAAGSGRRLSRRPRNLARVTDAIAFLKGHGTENDFVLLPDADGRHGSPAPDLVRALCDRRAGLGADGVIRVVRTDASDDPAARAGRDEADVVHGLPQRRRVAVGDVRQRRAGLRPLPGRAGGRRRPGSRCRSPPVPGSRR